VASAVAATSSPARHVLVADVVVGMGAAVSFVWQSVIVIVIGS
jgi:hypothetical protein